MDDSEVALVIDTSRRSQSIRPMRTIPTASLLLSLLLAATALPTLAQDDATPEPSPETTAAAPDEPTAEPATASATLAFVEPAWRRVSTAKSPAAREDHTWTVDANGRYAYLFGGRDGDREFGDLWRYDLQRDRWKKLSPKGNTPQPRFGHSAVWADSHGLVLFAGQRGPDFFDDLWAFDPERERWRKLLAGGSAPKARYGSCMVVGPDGRLWMSHGFTDAGRFDDTRAYNLKSERWASITPDGRVPGERCLHDCFTTTADELVLYAGQDDGAFALGDLWVMSRDRTWQRLDDPKPKPRRLYAVTEAGDFAYIFGGAGNDNVPLKDLWRVDRQTLEFERVGVDGNHPTARFAGTLITDHQRGRLLLFGGEGNKARNDLWELIDRSALTDGPVEAAEAEADQAPDDGAETTSETTPQPDGDAADA